jgi:hypothetical protein
VERSQDLLWLGGNPGALVYLLGSDPHFILPIPAHRLHALQQGGALEIEMEYPSPNQAMSRLPAGFLAQLDKGVPVEQLESLRSYVAAHSATHRRELSTDRLLQQLAAARTRANELERSLSWRITAPLRWGGGLILGMFRQS